MFRKLQSFMNSQAETSEDHANQDLRTHYFKATKDDIISYMAAVIEEDNHFQELGTSAERGEITFEINNSKKYFVVLTAITLQGRHTAVDINISSESGLPFQNASCERMIAVLYERLKGKFQLIGTGLAENY